MCSERVALISYICQVLYSSHKSSLIFCFPVYYEFQQEGTPGVKQLQAVKVLGHRLCRWGWEIFLECPYQSTELKSGCSCHCFHSAGNIGFKTGLLLLKLEVQITSIKKYINKYNIALTSNLWLILGLFLLTWTEI